MCFHTCFILERIAEGSQILRRDAHVLPKLLSCEEYCRRDKWEAHRRLIAAISEVNAVNLLVAFYDIHGRKRQVLFFYFVPDTTRDCAKCAWSRKSLIDRFYEKRCYSYCPSAALLMFPYKTRVIPYVVRLVLLQTYTWHFGRIIIAKYFCRTLSSQFQLQTIKL
jgi:hypothetical protein